MKFENEESKWRNRIGLSIGELKTRLRSLQAADKRFEEKLDRILSNNRISELTAQIESLKAQLKEALNLNGEEPWLEILEWPDGYTCATVDSEGGVVFHKDSCEIKCYSYPSPFFRNGGWVSPAALHAKQGQHILHGRIVDWDRYVVQRSQENL